MKTIFNIIITMIIAFGFASPSYAKSDVYITLWKSKKDRIANVYVTLDEHDEGVNFEPAPDSESKLNGRAGIIHIATSGVDGKEYKFTIKTETKSATKIHLHLLKSITLPLIQTYVY